MRAAASRLWHRWFVCRLIGHTAFAWGPDGPEPCVACGYDAASNAPSSQEADRG